MKIVVRMPGFPMSRHLRLPLADLRAPAPAGPLLQGKKEIFERLRRRAISRARLLPSRIFRRPIPRRDQNVKKTTMAARMQTSRAALDRLLDPANASVTLATLNRAAKALEIKIDLVPA